MFCIYEILYKMYTVLLVIYFTLMNMPDISSLGTGAGVRSQTLPYSTGQWCVTPTPACLLPRRVRASFNTWPSQSQLRWIYPPWGSSTQAVTRDLLRTQYRGTTIHLRLSNCTAGCLKRRCCEARRSTMRRRGETPRGRDVMKWT